MKSLKLSLLALVAASFTCAAFAVTSDNLADLIATHGSLSIGDKTYSNFGLSTSGITVDASNINVIAKPVDSFGVYYLDFQTFNEIALVGAGNADLLLSYTVTASGGLISMIDQFYAGSGRDGSRLSIDETAIGGNAGATSHLDETPDGHFDLVGPNLILRTGSTPNPQQTIDVTKDIRLFGVTGGLISVSDIQQSFHQVPDAGFTASLLGMGLLGLAVLRRKLNA